MADTALFCGATGSRGIHPTSARCTRDRDVNQPDSRPTRVPCQNTPRYPRHRRQSCCKEWFKCTRVRICPRHELAKTSRLEGYQPHPRSAPIALAHVSNRALARPTALTCRHTRVNERAGYRDRRQRAGHVGCYEPVPLRFASKSPERGCADIPDQPG